MSYLHLTREHARERAPEYDTRYRPLVRRDTKRQRTITLSDDEDDYPYSRYQKPAKSSRALVVREPQSQLERYNIWSDRQSNELDDDEQRWAYERKTKVYTPSRRYRSQPEAKSKREAEDRKYKLDLQATFSRPSVSSSSSASFWPATLFRTSKEKWSNNNWETTERSRSKEYRRRDSFWEVEQEKDEEEQWSSSRQLKRTKTDEFTRPLSGWRRDRVIYGSYM